MRRALAVAVITTLALAGCTGTAEEPEPGASAAVSPAPSPSQSAGETSSPSEPAAPSPSPDDAIEVEIEGDEISPKGKRIDASTGEPVTLRIESDRAAELHVHSLPEQEIEVAKGGSTVEITVENPGLVDVEEHESGVVILQLEVR